MSTVKVSQYWFEGFAEAAERAGIQQERVPALYKAAQRLQLQKQNPEAFEAGLQMILKSAAPWGAPGDAENIAGIPGSNRPAARKISVSPAAASVVAPSVVAPSANLVTPAAAERAAQAAIPVAAREGAMAQLGKRGHGKGALIGTAILGALGLLGVQSGAGHASRSIADMELNNRLTREREDWARNEGIANQIRSVPGHTPAPRVGFPGGMMGFGY